MPPGPLSFSRTRRIIPTTKVPTDPDTSAELERARRRRRRRRRFFVLLALLALVGAMLFPPAYQLAAKTVLRLWAWRQGVILHITDVDGSVFEPLRLSGVKFTGATASGARVDGHLESLSASIDPRRLVIDRHLPLIASLTAERGSVTVTLPEAGDSESPAAAGDAWPAFPEVVAIHHLDIALHAAETRFALRDVEFTTDPVAGGICRAASAGVYTPGLSQTFNGIAGTTVSQRGSLSLRSVKLNDDLAVAHATVSLDRWAEGRANIDFALDAFGGQIRGEIRSRIDTPASELEIGGFFSRLSVARLATLLAPQTPAGGHINAGRFSFRGSLRRLDRATVSVRLDATDFRWADRRWNHLVFSGTLVEQKLTLNEFNLEQAGNSLTVDGRLDLPTNERPWWAGGFSLNVSAQINDLTQLSALLGPDLDEAAGRLTVEGSIRGRDRHFTGQLIASGGDLRYAGAPIDRLQATIRLSGNELQLVNFELAHKTDFVRGRGVVNILGQKRYWGELDAGIRDLSLYRGAAPATIVPANLAGGLTLRWSGDGTTSAHSGAFFADLRKLRLAPAGTRAVNAVLEATYSPENVYFTKFEISQDDLALSAVLNASPDTLRLDKIQFRQGSRTPLRGSARLPVNFWTLWRTPPASLLQPGQPLGIEIDARELQLADLARLIGRSSPVQGVLTARLTASGAIDDLRATGTLSLADGAAPRFAAVTAEALFDQHLAQIVRCSGDAFGGRLTASGEVNLRNLRDPSLRVRVESESTRLTLPDGLALTFDSELDATGTWSGLYLDGTATVEKASLQTTAFDFAPAAPAGTLWLPSAPPVTREPCNDWRYDIRIRSSQPLRLSPHMTFQPELALSGRASAPHLAGTIAVSGSVPKGAASPISDYSGLIQMGDDPHLAFRGTGRDGTVAYAVGSVADPAFTVLDKSFPPAPEGITPPEADALSLDVPLALELAHGHAHSP